MEKAVRMSWGVNTWSPSSPTHMFDCDTSPMGTWIKSCCDLSDSEASVSASELYKHFKQYRIDAGDKEDKIMSSTAFGNRLTDQQIYGVKNSKGLIDRVGIRLLAPGETPKVAGDLGALDAAAAAPPPAAPPRADGGHPLDD